QRLTESSKMRHPEVDWRGISGLRNRLVHGYFVVDLETIWTIIQRDLPVLASAVTPKPAIRGHFKTGQRAAPRT
ncbi:MAG: HepT-like ribonuclease domain-containing protein, partial [Planctomycetota bacterium]